MAFSINEISAQLTGGGARPSKFQVQLINPGNGAGDVKFPFMCQAASFPNFTVGQIQVPYFGRKIKVAGDRVWGEWTTTIQNDEDFLIRNAMEEWGNKVNSFEGNLRTFGSSSPLDYKSQALVYQYSQTGTILRVGQFNGLWPMEIGPIELSWDATDQIETFQVTFCYDWFNVSGGSTGNAGGQ